MDKAAGVTENDADDKETGAEGRPTTSKMIKDSHLTQSDLKLKQ